MRYLCIAFLFTITGFSQMEREIIYLWNDGAPGFEHLMNEKEQSKDYWVKNVNNPSLIVYKPEQSNGTAIIVCPGGGHEKLVITSEGDRAAKYLNTLGITVFVLKYRLPREENSPYSLDIHLREDGLRAMRIVKSKSKEYNIKPDKIGMMGFSAGGEVVAEVVYKNNEGVMSSKDIVDQISAFPNFQILVYPGPLGIPEEFPVKLPPAFMVAANDDECCSTPVVKILNGYRSRNASVEMHLYSKGGHAFNIGTRSELESIKSWTDLLENWLKNEGFMQN